MYSCKEDHKIDMPKKLSNSSQGCSTTLNALYFLLFKCTGVNNPMMASKLAFYEFVDPCAYEHCEQIARGGGLLSLKSYVNVPAEPQKSDFLYTNFSPNYPPISIPFSIEKQPILPKLGAFYNNLLKIHPIFEFGLLRFC